MTSDWRIDAGPSLPRDFRGYGSRPPALAWPDDARVAVSFVVNFEEGAELSVSAGDARNESVYEMVGRIDAVPDPCLDSHFEYGTRAGYWRIMEVLADLCRVAEGRRIAGTGGGLGRSGSTCGRSGSTCGRSLPGGGAADCPAARLGHRFALTG